MTQGISQSYFESKGGSKQTEKMWQSTAWLRRRMAMEERVEHTMMLLEKVVVLKADIQSIQERIRKLRSVV